MKKYIVALVALVSLFSANVAEAQLRIGPMAGVSFTTLKFNQGGIVSVDGAAGPAAGVFLEKMMFFLDFLQKKHHLCLDIVIFIIFVHH